MEHRPSPLILLAALAAVMLVSGCTGLDPAALAKSNSMIQQFLDDHPNAQIKVTHFTAEQAKNMIDQIRSDCDNPYLDEKEFYRVNVTDTETNFFAVVWIDWANRSIECVYKIGTEGKTIEKPNEGGCESHSSYKCDSGNLYWFDSCGNKQDKKLYCQYGCSGQSCLGNCTSNAAYRCYGDHVYWFDSCGNKQEKKEYCNYGCGNGFCKAKPAEKTCEEAGGYCAYRPVCGNGVCEAGEPPLCETPPCPEGQACAQNFICKQGICPQDCEASASSASSGGGGQATTTGMMVNAETATSVSVETTATSTVVSYQCKSGYEVSPKYFCKEGGICCIPKTTPPPTTEFCGTSTQGPCSNDSECITGGCSGQICQSVQEEPSATTCEYKDCYNAGNYGMACKCIIETVTPAATAAIIGEPAVQGRCKWTRTIACTADAKICPDGTAVGRTGPNCEFAPCPTKCGNGVCEDGEANYCPPCTYSEPACMMPCTAGTCPKDCPATCKDSDGGKNYYQAGTAVWNGQSLSDVCNDEFTLTEKFCAESGEIKWETYKCPNGCKEGACIKETACAKEGEKFSLVYKDQYPERCCEGLTGWNSGMDTRIVQNGACVETGNVAGSPIGTCIKCGDGVCGLKETICNCPQDCKASATCTDSDGGKNYYVKGITKGDAPTGSYYEAEDACMTGNAQPGQLAEHYCDQNSKHTFEIYQCPHGCQNASCTYPICGDGYCESVTCTANGCPQVETIQNCPTDCISNATCYSNNDCPSITGEQYCDANNASCYTTTNYVCEKPGSPNAKCVSGGSSGYCNVCHNGCSNGICLPPICGDNLCTYGESCASCSLDCGICPSGGGGGGGGGNY